MTDCLNKKYTFPNSNITIKIVKNILINSKYTVYHCVDVEKPVINYSIKIMKISTSEKMVINSVNTEMFLLLSLKNSNNAIRLIDWFSHEDKMYVTYYILLEHFMGESLSDYIEKISLSKNTISESSIWKILYSIAKGLKDLHSTSYAHRNLTLDNVFLAADKNFKIFNFGNASNKIFEKINTRNQSEVIFEVTRFTQGSYQAPEQLNLASGFIINEKVDLYCLGIILYQILFDVEPYNEKNKLHQIKGDYLLTEDMCRKHNPKLVELMKNLMSQNPKDRFSADEVINYIEKNWEQFNSDSISKTVSLQPKDNSFIRDLSKVAAIVFKRHSTQFWVIKLTTDEFHAPKMKYVKLLLIKAWKKREKIIKFFNELVVQPIHHNTIIAIKGVYVLHQYFLNGPPEVNVQEGFNVDEFLSTYNGVWTKRYEENQYDQEDLMKNSLISKFIMSSTEFLFKKINFIKKYPFLENNYSLEFTILNFTYFDFNSLIEKNFIKDSLQLYGNLLDLFVNMPISITQLSQILDTFLHVLNEECIYLFTLLFLIIVAFKNHHSKYKKEEVTAMFDEKFVDVSMRFNESIELYKKFRADINSGYYFLEIPNNFSVYIKNLNNNLKFFPNFEFNIKAYYMQVISKDIVGIRMHHSMLKYIDMDILDFPAKYTYKSDGNLFEADVADVSLSNSQQQQFKSNLSYQRSNHNFHSSSLLNHESVRNNFNLAKDSRSEIPQNYSTINNPNISKQEKYSSGGGVATNDSRFDFNEDKFNNSFANFNFDENRQDKMPKQISKERGKRENKENKNYKEYKGRLSIDNEYYDVLRGKLCEKKTDKIVYNDDNNVLDGKSKSRVTASVAAQYQEKNPLNQEGKNNQQAHQKEPGKFGNELKKGESKFFTANSKIQAADEDSVSMGKDKVQLQQTQTQLKREASLKETIQKPKQENYFDILDDLFNSTPGGNKKDEIASHRDKEKSKTIAKLEKETKDKDLKELKDPKAKVHDEFNIGGAIINLTPQAQAKLVCDNEMLEKVLLQMNNIYNKEKDKDKTNSGDKSSSSFSKEPAEKNSGSEYKCESPRSSRSEVSNINIFNFRADIQNLSIYDENLNIEEIANAFLFKELSKANLHWLISSKDIKLGDKIGFGGTSEVFKANYRGTDVAVKKLRILEVHEENLKEFKREVSSLIRLRHPSLVLFMGAIAEKDNICIVTEYCAGGTLFSILHQRRELIITWDLRLRILLEIAVGMNFLHTNNPPIIHRDLKSLNILLTEKVEKPTDNTKVKISDFGLSKIIKKIDNDRDKMTGQLGTCHWMAPEVIENKHYTLKADVYSFGIIIWEVCSRKTPYSNMTPQQISLFVTTKDLRPDQKQMANGTPPNLKLLMNQCLKKDPNERPQFSEIIETLKIVMKGEKDKGTLFPTK